MTTKTPETARSYVVAADLPEPRARRGTEATGSTVMNALDTTKQQAAVIGSEVVAFAQGVPGKFRQDLVNSTLLAQLVANKQVSDPNALFDWYNAYFDALANIGWVVQNRDFATYVESGQNFEAHKAIIGVLAAILGPASTALVMITGTLEALKGMDADSPWITLFEQASMTANSAHFQIGAVEKGPDDEPFVTLAAFGLNATTKMTQILVFRARSSDVTLRHCSGAISIDPAIADAVRQPLLEKLASHAVEFVKSLPDF